MMTHHPSPSELSYEAYQSIVDRLPDMRRHVYDYIASCGTRGATGEEVWEGLGASGNSTHGRTAELRRLGLIKQIGVRTTKSGRRAAVYASCRPYNPQMELF